MTGLTFPWINEHSIQWPRIKHFSIFHLVLFITCSPEVTLAINTSENYINCDLICIWIKTITLILFFLLENFAKMFSNFICIPRKKIIVHLAIYSKINKAEITLELS